MDHLHREFGESSRGVKEYLEYEKTFQPQSPFCNTLHRTPNVDVSSEAIRDLYKSHEWSANHLILRTNLYRSVI